MSLSVKHLHQTFVINFTKQMIKKNWTQLKRASDDFYMKQYQI